MGRTIELRIAPVLSGLLLVCALTAVQAQTEKPIEKLPGPPPPERSIEDLNYLGGEAAMPAFTDNMIDVHSRYRQGMLRHGLAFRVNGGPQYTQNLLDAPVAAHDQTYVGQREFEAAWLQPILSWDMRQLHVRRAQLFSGAAWNWVTWNPAGPKAMQLWALYFYKEFGADRVELKTGYIAHNMNFVGLFVGGSTATGTQGVYAVLPYEAGMSFFPLTAPAFDLKVNGPRHTYYKGAVQRSMDPNGGPAEVARNHTGFRFDPRGDKLVHINEVGYSRLSAKDQREAWLRLGYIGNATRYANAVTGQTEKGNHCAYILMDGQITQPNPSHAGQGLYGGASYMTVPERKNAYARYYEARLYQNAPFHSRPSDVAAVVASRTGYSPVFTDNLAAQGKTVWRASTTVTGSYSLHAAPGNYVSLGLGYLYGPAITPRVNNALTFTATWNFFF